MQRFVLGSVAEKNSTTFTLRKLECSESHNADESSELNA